MVLMKEKVMKSLYLVKISKFLLVAIVAVAFSVNGMGVAIAASGKGDLAFVDGVNEVSSINLNVTWGKAEIVNLPDNVSDILVANPDIVDVQAVKADRLYVVGRNIGDTNIIVLDRSGNVVKRIDVHVSYDLQAIQLLVDNLFPNENVKISSIHDQILLTGTVSNPDVAGRVSSLVAHYVGDLQDADNKSIDELIANMLEVRGEQQVMLKVRIIEAERSVIKELGVDLKSNDPNELAVSTLFGTIPPSSIGDSGKALSFGSGNGLALTQDAIGSASAFFDSNISGIGMLGLFLEALDEENLVNILAEPNLTAVSGQQAGFLAGGEFPVPTGRDQFGNITVEFREFGVSLNFKPIVLSDDRINLQLNTEVSSLNNSNAVVLADLTIPGLDIRRAETTIEMPSGGSLMIAGLLQSQTAQGLAGLPGIKDTPVLGDLISSESFRRDETEMVVIVTAYLVEPFADEKEGAKEVPIEDKSALARIFKANINRNFDVGNSDVFAQSRAYGYIID